MKTLSRFVTKFNSIIAVVLSCFDRVIFKAHSPLSNGPALEGFVDHVLKIRRCDFMAFAEEQSEIVVNHAKQTVAQYGTLNSPGFGAHSAQQGLNAPYDAKVIGDNTGLTFFEPGGDSDER